MPDHLDRARTPLLTLITLESLDEDYKAAGRRRMRDRASGGPGGPAPAAGGPARRTASRGRVLVVLAVFGLLVAVAAVQNSRESSVDDASRASLIKRIDSRRKDVATTEQRLADLRKANTKADSALTTLGTRLNGARDTAAGYGALTGLQPVSGPAIGVELDSAPYAGSNEQVRDSDIALLVNGLWGAGAEAVSVNGQRVTARTGIRTSGDAIEVNGIGVAPPYTILAIGDTGQLEANFVSSTGGQDFIALADRYDFRYDMHDVGQVQMAAAPPSLTRLRSATPMSATTPGRPGKKQEKGGNG